MHQEMEVLKCKGFSHVLWSSCQAAVKAASWRYKVRTRFTCGWYAVRIEYRSIPHIQVVAFKIGPVRTGVAEWRNNLSGDPWINITHANGGDSAEMYLLSSS